MGNRQVISDVHAYDRGVGIKTVLFIIIVIFLFLLVRFLERKNLYFPLRNIEATPGDIGLGYSEVEFLSEDGVTLYGWYIPSRHTRAVLLFCHGNGGNISHRLDKISMLNSLDLDVFIFDYRGYGKSGGRPDEQGLYRDAVSAYRYLTEDRKFVSRMIVGYGESLGGAVVIDLAARYPLAGIIVEGSFTSLRDMAKRHFPLIPAFLYKSRFDSLEKIRSVHSPLLIFHSADDEIVPFELGKRLFSAAKGKKIFVRLSGGHNDAFMVERDTYTEQIERFVGGL